MAFDEILIIGTTYRNNEVSFKVNNEDAYFQAWGDYYYGNTDTPTSTYEVKTSVLVTATFFVNSIGIKFIAPDIFIIVETVNNNKHIDINLLALILNSLIEK